ncbi:MAG TPA: biotin carboxylase N-terminal domain-containing protein [Solirubrobacteraceae bacterium]|nr:biotin carboxylase N-terminal domain-containing protein [Solirubrobacteraceae bacterium]
MRSVFIPNRGEIAVRIVGACRTVDLECVVGASAADMDGMAAQRADRVVCLGPGPPAESYMRPDVVVQAATDSGCDAIHPGYGFLSESARLARLARENDLVFVGPPTEALELVADPPAVRAEAVRAGLRAVRDDRSAGDPSGEPARVRHVQVQIAADDRGHVLHLGERDCSVQRRRQALVGEAPAPALCPTTRAHVCDGAVALAERIGYRNLGTVEFVIDADSGEAYFLDVTCSIQPEHPMTEAVTGLDLVAMQLQLAAGKRLAVAQQAISFTGHAVECRLTAEDPAHNYILTPGVLSLFAVPERLGLRVDTHCQPGANVPPYYDALLAKLIAHSDGRDHASDILLDALEDLDVEGVETNRTLLISVLGHPDFRAGQPTTDWLDRAIP